MPGKFEVKTQKDGQFYFVLKAPNGEIIAKSEAYKAKASCMNGIESVRKNAPGASIDDITAGDASPKKKKVAPKKPEPSGPRVFVSYVTPKGYGNCETDAPMETIKDVRTIEAELGKRHDTRVTVMSWQLMREVA